MSVISPNGLAIGLSRPDSDWRYLSVLAEIRHWTAWWDSANYCICLWLTFNTPTHCSVLRYLCLKLFISLVLLRQQMFHQMHVNSEEKSLEGCISFCHIFIITPHQLTLWRSLDGFIMNPFPYIHSPVLSIFWYSIASDIFLTHSIFLSWDVKRWEQPWHIRTLNLNQHLSPP